MPSSLNTVSEERRTKKQIHLLTLFLTLIKTALQGILYCIHIVSPDSFKYSMWKKELSLSSLIGTWYYSPFLPISITCVALSLHQKDVGFMTTQTLLTTTMEAWMWRRVG